MAEPLSREEKIRRAVRVLTETSGLVALKLEFLKKKGMSESEIMEALDIASGGALVASALGWD